MWANDSYHIFDVVKVITADATFFTPSGANLGKFRKDGSLEQESLRRLRESRPPCAGACGPTLSFRKEVTRLFPACSGIKGELELPSFITDSAGRVDIYSLRKRWSGQIVTDDSTAMTAIDPSLLSYTTSVHQKYQAWVMAYDDFSDR
jgi:hypothetical protein